MAYYRMEGERYLKDLWRNLAGLPDREVTTRASLSELKQTEWSPEFEANIRDCIKHSFGPSYDESMSIFDKLIPYMKNRLIIGALRYGRLGDPGKPKYDRVARAKLERTLYLKDKNLEHLVDAMNMYLLLFVEDHVNVRVEVMSILALIWRTGGYDLISCTNSEHTREII